MAALQKGHFGKGHLQKRNPAAGEEEKETQAVERRRTQKRKNKSKNLKKYWLSGGKKTKDKEQ